MIFAECVAKLAPLTDAELRDVFLAGLESIESRAPRRRVLVVPPDITRFHSRAGVLTQWAWQHFGERLTDVLPAIGTHAAMTPDEITSMYGAVPHDLFRVHRWRKDLDQLGEVPSEVVSTLSDGLVDFSWPAEVNRLVSQGGHDLILSVGQVLPHEVVGMANYNKNIFIGTGGHMGINLSHYLGAVCGIENILGRAHTPVRALLNYASDNFASHLPIVYALTVVGVGADGSPETRGLFVGDDIECYEKAAAFAQKHNLFMVDRPLDRVVAYLDPSEFRSTWLGNKAVYRTRMAIADGGELLVLAPGLKEFGEDVTIDMLIRRHGYYGTPATAEKVQQDPELAAMLGAAAHLMQGSSEGRFTITYAPGNVTREEIESVGFGYADIAEAIARYNPENLKAGYNTLPDGEEVYYVPNPALGLWAHKSRFKE